MATTIEQLVPIKTKAPDVWDVERIRKDFPVLSQMVHGNRLVYLDNAASSQVPQMVIERGSQYLKHEHSNIHRGVHYLSMKAPAKRLSDSSMPATSGNASLYAALPKASTW